MLYLIFIDWTAYGGKVLASYRQEFRPFAVFSQVAWRFLVFDPLELSRITRATIRLEALYCS